MKSTFIKNSIIACLVMSIILLTPACNKNRETQRLIEKTNPQEIQVIEEVPWVPIIGALAYIIVHVTEGKYTSTTTTGPDGSTTTTIECKGWGHCSIKGTTNSPGFSSNQSISSVDYGDDYDYTGSAQLVRTTDDRILLKIDNNEENSVVFNRFFYDKEILVSRPLIIDNYEVLQILNRKNPVVIEGTYEVYHYRNWKYIVVD